MSRTKTASKKKTSPDQKVSPEKSQSASAKKTQTQTQNSKPSSSPNERYTYDSLARQTMDLWRDQLSHFLNNPDAMKDINKVMEPAAKMMSPQISQMFAPLFSNGMDLWLLMLEQLSKAANMNTRSTSGQDDQKKQTSTAGQAQGFQGRAENRTSAASALSGASAYAVAQLASRLADLEKRFAEFESAGRAEQRPAQPAARKPSAKKKAPVAVVAEFKRKTAS